MRDGFFVRALVLEFGNIRAGDESLVARAGENDDTDVLVLLELGKMIYDRLPHLERERVQAIGVVENEMRNAGFLAHNDFCGRTHDALP
jgi:hypothetical protein